MIADRARCVELCHISSGWFKHLEPHRTLLIKQLELRQNKVCRALSATFGVVQAHRTSSHPLKTHAIRESEVCRALSHTFGVVQAP